MKRTAMVQEFWTEFCRRNADIDPAMEFQVWYFGNAHEMSLDLGNLVLAGKKTATASLDSVNKIKPEDAPVPDGYSVVTDFEGNPMCIIQTTEIRHTPFDAVDAQFAFDEGEGDQTLAYWRSVHRPYFERESAALGLEFDEKSMVCCEWFRLLFP